MQDRANKTPSAMISNCMLEGRAVLWRVLAPTRQAAAQRELEKANRTDKSAAQLCQQAQADQVLVHTQLCLSWICTEKNKT